jgi:hypothetical protein
MHALLDSLSYLVVSFAGWMNQHQQHVIHYLMEENRVLREQIGNRRIVSLMISVATGCASPKSTKSLSR